MPPAVSRSLSDWETCWSPLQVQAQLVQQDEFELQSGHHVLLSSAALPMPDAMMPYDEGSTLYYTPSVPSSPCSNILDLKNPLEYALTSSHNILEDYQDSEEMAAPLWSTSANKQVTLDVPEDSWVSKAVQSWSAGDVKEWLQYRLGVAPGRLEQLCTGSSTGEGLTGADLMHFREHDTAVIEALEREIGVSIRKPLDELLASMHVDHTDYTAHLPPFGTVAYMGDPSGRLPIKSEAGEEVEPSEQHMWGHHPALHGASHLHHQGHLQAGYSGVGKNEHLSSGAEDSGEEEEEEEREATSSRGRPGRRGRPPSLNNRVAKRKLEKKNGRLWEFIRDLLKDPAYCPSLICWENHDEGVFRFVSSEKVAQLWGSKRGNTKMTYEKLSRAMRTYYASKILVPVPKTGRYPKKLVYQFGPASSGWGKEVCKPHVYSYYTSIMYYYKSNILQPVTHRRLVYRFGPNATNWRSNNPNFRKPV